MFTRFNSCLFTERSFTPIHIRGSVAFRKHIIEAADGVLSPAHRIIDGLETLDELEKLPVNEKTFRPLTEIRIKDVTIHANPFAG